MSSYFPRHTADWRMEEPAIIRRLTMSVVETSVIAGIAGRLLRSIVVTYGGGPFYLAGTFALGVTIVLGLLAAHLSNYTMRTWLWRAPTFALLESLAAIATSAVLIAFHREPVGSRERAEFADLPTMAQQTLLFHFVAIITFTLVLAAVVYSVRYVLIKRERTAAGADAARAELDEATPLEGHPPVEPR
jgi:hypothetical protein